MSNEEILYKKEEILHHRFLNASTETIVEIASNLMSEYAEKVAVAFAEWAVRNCIEIQDGWVCQYGQFSTTSDLYKYFINNVYNK